MLCIGQGGHGWSTLFTGNTLIRLIWFIFRLTFWTHNLTPNLCCYFLGSNKVREAGEWRAFRNNWSGCRNAWERHQNSHSLGLTSCPIQNTPQPQSSSLCCDPSSCHSHQRGQRGWSSNITLTSHPCNLIFCNFRSHFDDHCGSGSSGSKHRDPI